MTFAQRVMSFRQLQLVLLTFSQLCAAGADANCDQAPEYQSAEHVAIGFCVPTVDTRFHKHRSHRPLILHSVSGRAAGSRHGTSSLMNFVVELAKNRRPMRQKPKLLLVSVLIAAILRGMEQTVISARTTCHGEEWRQAPKSLRMSLINSILAGTLKATR